MDKLDDIVSGAMRALEGTTPAGYFDELPSRIEARMEGSMQSQTDSDQHSAPFAGGPPPADPDRVEDSGLHDIKALASTAKRRISRRATSQHDAEDALLSASNSGMHAVALPDPARMIALPTVEEARSLAASASGQMAAIPAAAAAEAPAGAHAPRAANQPRKRPAWVYAVSAVAAAAAAAALFVATRPGGGEGGARKAEAPTAAPAVASADDDDAARAGVAAGSAAPAPAVQSIAVDVAEPADVGLVAPPAQEEAPAATGAVDADGKTERRKVDAEPAKVKERTKAEGPAPDKGDKGDKADEKVAKPDPTKVVPTDGKGADGKPKDDLDKSIEDLLNSPVEKKKSDKPDKTELTSKELRDGLSAVVGTAKACYQGEAGTVKVKITIDPSGKVSKSSATGTFAGTPSGDCVAAALKGASFPAWDGAPMSTTYAVLLSD